MKEPQWLQKEDVLLIHEKIVAASVASDGMRDEGLLESALSRAQNLFFYQDATLFDLAAGYADSIARHYPFVGGNKRTAFAVADLFLQMNGYHYRADQEEAANIMVALAEQKIPRSELAEFFSRNCKSMV